MKLLDGASETTCERETGRSRRVAGVVLGVGCALHVGKLPMTIPLLREKWSLTLLQAGFLLSLVQLAGMSLGLLVGLIADRLGPPTGDAARTRLGGLRARRFPFVAQPGVGRHEVPHGGAARPRPAAHAPQRRSGPVARAGLVGHLHAAGHGAGQWDCTPGASW